MSEEDGEPNPKRIKPGNEASQLHIGEDVSSPNTKLVLSIAHKLYLDENSADVHFIFEISENGSIERIPAHKLFLSTGSKVFDVMFYGPMCAGDEVKISNANPSAFKEFLQFFYLDEVNLTTDNIADVMNLVRMYGIERCMAQCVDFLKDTMTDDDVCTAYQLAVQYELDELKRFCQCKISANAENVLKSDDFLNCNHVLLQSIMELDSLMCDETNVFDACVAWAENACKRNGSTDASDGKSLREQLGHSVLHSIHFNRMKIEDFAIRNAKFKGLFTIEELTEIVQIIGCPDFTSDTFAMKPLSYKLFTCDEKRIIECSFDQLRAGGRGEWNHSAETVAFTCNRPILLHKMRFPTVNVNSQKTSNWSAIVKLEFFQKSNGKDKLLWTEKFSVTFEAATSVKLSEPLLIHPKRSYEIRFSYQGKDIFTCRKIRPGTIKIGDLELKVTSEYYLSLPSSMHFNRI